MLCLQVYICTMCAQDHLQLKLQIVRSHHMDAGTKSRPSIIAVKCSQTLSHLFRPQ